MGKLKRASECQEIFLNCIRSEEISVINIIIIDVHGANKWNENELFDS